MHMNRIKYQTDQTGLQLKMRATRKSWRCSQVVFLILNFKSDYQFFVLEMQCALQVQHTLPWLYMIPYCMLTQQIHFYKLCEEQIVQSSFYNQSVSV